MTEDNNNNLRLRPSAHEENPSVRNARFERNAARYQGSLLKNLEKLNALFLKLGNEAETQNEVIRTQWYRASAQTCTEFAALIREPVSNYTAASNAIEQYLPIIRDIDLLLGKHTLTIDRTSEFPDFTTKEWPELTKRKRHHTTMNLCAKIKNDAANLSQLYAGHAGVFDFQKKPRGKE